MPRRGNRENLLAVGTELNLVPFLDMMTVLVIFLLATITGFLSFTMLNASIPRLVPDSAEAAPPSAQGAQLLLMLRITSKGFLVDPNVQGGKSLPQVAVGLEDGKYDYESLKKVAVAVKEQFPEETRVLIIGEPKIIYDTVVQVMDTVRETKPGQGDLFTDVTLSIL